ncbi:MAG: CAP domain-containing protein [Actinomycetota bacterium]|nr:CAP domain-containing protein [Actinomycetota bacterium]
MYRRLSAAVTAAVISGTLLSAAPAGAQREKCWHHYRSERAFAKKVNLARSNKRVPRLQLDKQLTVVARRHSWEMAKRNNLVHTPDSTLARRVTNWRVLGENIGVGGTVKSLHRAFMDSAPHRANALYSPFRHVGVGVIRRNDRIWVTFVFESAADPGTRLTPRVKAC